MTLRGALAGLVLAGLTLTACGGSETPTGPTDPPVGVAPTVLSIAPTSGPTAGGTAVTVSGVNFSAGATVAIGGVAATNVTFVSSTTIKATTGASAAGAAEVTVTVDGRSGTLAAAFTYVALPPPTISGISPASGTTAGGTAVTVTGTNFAAGATTVTFGGTAATGVVVASSTSLQAVTPARAAGQADVVVTVGGQGGTLPKGFTYVVPGPNLPPVIGAITIQSTQANAPPSFADLNEEVPVSATVTDAETPVSQLTFEWSATLGTFTGTGASVRWRAPASAPTPATVTLTLKVTEAVSGAPGTQSSSKTATLSLHNSLKEISDMSYQFLLEFSQQSLTPEQIVRNFYTGCPGRNEELTDVQNNQKNFKINSYSVATSFPVTISFSSRCPYQNKSGDGCAQVPVQWKSTCLSSDPLVCTKGLTYTTTGTDQTTAVYRQDRWWLCDSNFNGSATSPYLPGFIR
jgi:hypothetical protein